MLSFAGSLRILVALEPCDMRAGFERLQGLVSEKLKEDVKSGTLFVFSNRRRTRLKIIYWDGSGLWILTKRLEKGVYFWPRVSQSGNAKMLLAPEAFVMLTQAALTCTGPNRGAGMSANRGEAPLFEIYRRILLVLRASLCQNGITGNGNDSP